jgi:hypothetical protein
METKAIENCIEFVKGYARKFKSETNEADAELSALVAENVTLRKVVKVAEYISLNRSNFTVGDRDGISSRIIDELAAVVDEWEKGRIK